MLAGTDDRNLEGIPDRRPEELELGGCIYCREEIGPKTACVFWPFSRVNAVAHVRCFVEAEEQRRTPIARPFSCACTGDHGQTGCSGAAADGEMCAWCKDNHRAVAS